MFDDREKVEFVHQTADGPSSFKVIIQSILANRHGVLYPTEYNVTMNWVGINAYRFDIEEHTVTEMVVRYREGIPHKVAYEFLLHLEKHGAPMNLPFNSTARKALGDALARLLTYHSAYMSKLPITAMTDEIPEDLQ